MHGLGEILRYINTIRYLKPIQIWHQLLKRLSGRRKAKIFSQVRKLHAKQVIPVKILIPALDFDEVYLSRFQVEGLLKNEIEILHETHLIDLTKWEVPEASHLWNYNLQYLEFLIPLAAVCGDTQTDQYFMKWSEYIDSWIEHPAKDSFEPYTISMRIPNLLICMNMLQDKLQGTILEKRLTDSIYQQYRYLLAAQEFALLANHYFENLKTILICSVLFGEEKCYKKYCAKFIREIDEQILSDGIHYERSILYHKIILEDMLRVYAISGSEEMAGKILPVIRCMADALASVSRGFSKMPLFNDTGDNVAKDTKSLLRAVQEVTGCSIIDDRTVFEKSGYYKLYAGMYALLFDCGQIGPSYMGGHTHCDCLSFELARCGKKLFVNSGTFQYQGGLRQFFRSTRAHNTVMIDEREQSELWGEHRAARRISNVKCQVENHGVVGEFRSFYGDCFQRRMRLTDDTLAIVDCIIANDKKKHCARHFFHINADCHFTSDDSQQVCVCNDSRKLTVIRIPDGSRWLIHREGDICSFAQDFGELKKKEVLEIRTLFEQNVEIQIDMELL